MLHARLSAALLGAMLSIQAHAATITVQADGLGDYPTLQAAIDAAAVGDTVLALPGTYTGVGNRDLDFAGTNFTLLGVGGSAATILDCEDQGRGIAIRSGEDSTSVLRGFTIKDGRNSVTAGGLLIEDSSPTLQDLLITSCQTSGKGGGAACYRGSPRIVDVRFESNVASTYHVGVLLGGGMYCEDASPRMYNVQFVGNLISLAFSDWSYDTRMLGGGLASFGGSPYLEGAVFADNYISLDYGLHGGGAVYVSGEITLVRATIYGNYAYVGSAIHGNTSYLSNTIIADNVYDQPIDGVAYLECCDLHGHGNHGEYVGFIADQYGIDGNISEDPRFCNVDEADFRLEPDSPCLPANNSCGMRIGAIGAGCGGTPVALSWFRASTGPGVVDLAWRLGIDEPDADFDLHAESEGISWPVSWQKTTAARYEGRDSSSALAGGGRVTYRLSGKLPGEDWQLLRTLDVEVPLVVPGQALGANYPNPFNPSTTIPFSLDTPASVSVTILDVTGRLVATLASEQVYPAGQHQLHWDGLDSAGRQMPSGVYFYRLEMPAGATARPMLLVK